MAKRWGGISVCGTGAPNKRASCSSLGAIAGIAAASDDPGNVFLDTEESAEQAQIVIPAQFMYIM